MSKVKVDIRRLPGNEDIPQPVYMSKHAAGVDISAAVTKKLVIKPGKIELVPTGLQIALPSNFEAQIRPRSGLALKHGIGILNSPGTIDADYRGEIGIIIINLGKKPFVINRGDRIAQMVISKITRAEFKITSVLSKTKRNDGGFGHTGK
ncbi:MAG: dUTP diphosphatase [bacterium]|nr:dUTP diphosphatase [bacterium]